MYLNLTLTFPCLTLHVPTLGKVASPINPPYMSYVIYLTHIVIHQFHNMYSYINHKTTSTSGTSHERSTQNPQKHTHVHTKKIKIKSHTLDFPPPVYLGNLPHQSPLTPNKKQPPTSRLYHPTRTPHGP